MPYEVLGKFEYTVTNQQNSESTPCMCDSHMFSLGIIKGLPLQATEPAKPWNVPLLDMHSLLESDADYLW